MEPTKTVRPKRIRRADRPFTWDDMVREEPMLEDLLKYARTRERRIVAHREDGEVRLDVYRAARCYREMKPELIFRVGWFRNHGPDFMRTSEAYDLAISTLWDALPDDFEEDEIALAWERAHEAELEEGEQKVVLRRRA